MPSQAEPRSLQIISSLFFAFRVSSAYFISNADGLGGSTGYFISFWTFTELNRFWVCWDCLISSTN
jgi:hypothetical protein